MDIYTTSFCLPRYTQLADAAVPAGDPVSLAQRHAHSLSTSSNGTNVTTASLSGDSPNGANTTATSDTTVRDGRKDSVDFGGPGTRRSTSTINTEYSSEAPSSAVTSAPSSVTSFKTPKLNGAQVQKMTEELQSGFSTLVEGAISRYSCAIDSEMVDLVAPVQPTPSTHQHQHNGDVDGFPVTDSTGMPSAGSDKQHFSYSSRSASSVITTGAQNQLVVLPNHKGFHFTISGGYQQVLAARGTIIRDAPFKRKSVVKVPRSEIVDADGVKSELRKKLDEIASLTKAHLAILGPSKDNDSVPAIGHGLEGDRNVDIVITGTYESVEQAKVRLLVLLDELAGLHSEICEIDYKLHSIIAGRKRSVIQTIQEETGTNIYFPSPLSGVLGGKEPALLAKQNLIFITGEFFGVQRARDMLYQVSMHKSKCIISRDTAILPRKLDWMLTERIEEVKAAMNDNGTFINLPVIGSQVSLISVFGDHRVNIERTIRSVMQLACHFYIGSYWLLPASFDVFMPPPSIAPSQVPAILKTISLRTGAEAVFKSNCFEFHGSESEVRAAIQMVSQLEQVKAFHHEIRFQLELANEHREFISGKKNGKLNKVMKSANVKIKFETFNDYNFLIDIAGSDGGALEGLTMLEEELPSEISFHVPESYHKRIIGVGGKNIQRIMKRYGVYVKFSNAEEFAALGGYIDNDDNVVARTPAKNAANLEHLKGSVMELVNPREKDFITETVTVPRRYHRVLLGEKAIFLHDIEHKTNSSFRFPNKESSSDTITVFGPESQIHIAAQMLLAHIPFEADFKVPNSEELKAAAQSADLQQLLDRVKHDLNITVLSIMKNEGKESIFRFSLNRSNLDFLPAARDILEDYLLSKKVDLPAALKRPRTDQRPIDPFQHFNSALFSSANRPAAVVNPNPAPPSPVEPKLFPRRAEQSPDRSSGYGTPNYGPPSGGHNSGGHSQGSHSQGGHYSNSSSGYNDHRNNDYRNDYRNGGGGGGMHGGRPSSYQPEYLSHSPQQNSMGSRQDYGHQQDRGYQNYDAHPQGGRHDYRNDGYNSHSAPYGSGGGYQSHGGYHGSYNHDDRMGR